MNTDLVRNLFQYQWLHCDLTFCKERLLGVDNALGYLQQCAVAQLKAHERIHADVTQPLMQVNGEGRL